MDIEDLLYRRPTDPVPSNNNELHNQTLLCVTDLVECCETPPRGNWYYPDGYIIVALDNGTNAKFQSNRGQYEQMNVNGSVRLWCRHDDNEVPPERGRFRCELPSAANPSVNQTLYVTILCKL